MTHRDFPGCFLLARCSTSISITPLLFFSSKICYTLSNHIYTFFAKTPITNLSRKDYIAIQLRGSCSRVYNQAIAACTASSLIMEPSTSISPLSREARADGSPLLRLPLELRSQIYGHALLNSRCPSSEDVYRNVLSAVWKDRPSPLLAVNGQVRDEVCNMLRKGPVTLRVTGQDMKFDSLGLSCFIAHQHCTFTGNIPALVVQVWAPNLERPEETSNIWNSLRRLRDDLARSCKRIRRLDIQFRDNELYTWSQDGILGCWLSYLWDLTGPQACDSDIVHMLRLFFWLNNTSKARIKLPASILDYKENESLAKYIKAIEYVMVNVPPTPSAGYPGRFF